MLADYDFGDFLWTMLVFFFWFMLIWMFIMVFADIFRRTDLSGGAKAGGSCLIFILPLFGILIYLIARPTIIDAREMSSASAGQMQGSAAYEPRPPVASASGARASRHARQRGSRFRGGHHPYRMNPPCDLLAGSSAIGTNPARLVQVPLTQAPHELPPMRAGGIPGWHRTLHPARVMTPRARWVLLVSSSTRRRIRHG